MTSLTETGASWRVLVIEDDRPFAEMLRDVLLSWGCEVRVAGEGPKAFAAARAFLPDVVICDVGLPRVGAYGVARALRADPALARSYLVALTALASADDSREAKAAGFDLHLTKTLAVNVLDLAFSDAAARLASPPAHRAPRCPFCRAAAAKPASAAGPGGPTALARAVPRWTCGDCGAYFV